MDLSPDKKWIYVSGKDLSLTKYDFKSFKLVKKTKQGTVHFLLSLIIVFKCISMKVDQAGQIWVHDAICKALLCFDSELNLLARINGHAISLCNYHPFELTINLIDYQNDIIMNEEKDQLLWFRGSNELGVVGTAKMRESRLIQNAVRGDVIRKLEANSNLSRSYALTLFESSKEKSSGIRGDGKSVITASKGRLLLEITNLDERRLIFSKPYDEITSKDDIFGDF